MDALPTVAIVLLAITLVVMGFGILKTCRVVENHPRPEPPSCFHFFPKLPTELRLMIWAYWCGKQPAVRHYISYDKDRYDYRKFDVQLEKFTASFTVINQRRTNYSRYMDPMTSEILAGDVVRGIQIWDEPPWTNLKDSVFFIHYKHIEGFNDTVLRDNLLGLYRTPVRTVYGSWRFLHRDYWWRQIRHLAFTVPESGEFTALHEEFFSWFRDLKSVFLLHFCGPPRFRWRRMPVIPANPGDPLRSKGFMKFDDLATLAYRPSKAMTSTYRRLGFKIRKGDPCFRRIATNFAGELEATCRLRYGNIDIQIVEDISQGFPIKTWGFEGNAMLPNRE
ncbi:uncharacterized protein F4822DRAFT_344001 [Hypoxylon trugodes]|uniref:uncharacterized protein n=1 Tax=Hypoxylon trugodes TaxID=326681 RepID=UPI00219734FF|nr:uncharacterized protein F4822DRAFT_344001 [Hypoxylon trugodes]KAI1385433.1 hypothetical protein F4822DRAFT_344001 [Hypoxylon trugodes]